MVQAAVQLATRSENLGPAERIINALVGYTDHMVHNRPGIVVTDPTTPVGLRWAPCTHRVEDGAKVVYRLDKRGYKTVEARIGILDADGKRVMANGIAPVAEYRPAGMFPEVATWMYSQVAEVWKLDNEFAARWASYAFGQVPDHDGAQSSWKDLKIVLAAFMLCQSRRGNPVFENGKVAFYDEDHREVGEAMVLLDGPGYLNVKQILRIRELLRIPAIAKINRDMGFSGSDRSACLEAWYNTTRKWLWYREQNPKMLAGLVKAAFRRDVMTLTERSHYKPETDRFFEVLRWKQVQAKDGRRTLAIGKEVAAAESWKDLDERAICEKIVKDKPGFKKIVGMLPKSLGLTRAIMAAAIESGSLSSKDLIIYSPTIEELGLMQVQDIREKWQAAVKASEDQRASNIAKKVRSKEAKETLEEGADNAIKAAVEEVTRGMRIYFMVDISGSMEVGIQEAITYLTTFLQGFPPDRVHVSVFNTSGRELPIRHPSAAGVRNAFSGISAGGGTAYASGIYALCHHVPQPDEDVLFIFVGDEVAWPFDEVVRASKLNPLAFGVIHIPTTDRSLPATAVQETARRLGIPCLMIDNKTFSDPYAVQRTIRNLIAATPVTRTASPTPRQRVTLVDQILKTELLRCPSWV